MARGLGYKEPKALLLTINLPDGSAPEEGDILADDPVRKWILPKKPEEIIRVVEWRSIYKWLLNHKRLLKKKPECEWAGRPADYLEVVEARLLNEEKPDGTMTVLNGFRFGEDEPYSYHKVKNVLRLAMDELRKRKDLREELDGNPDPSARWPPSSSADSRLTPRNSAPSRLRPRSARTGGSPPGSRSRTGARSRPPSSPESPSAENAPRPRAGRFRQARRR